MPALLRQSLSPIPRPETSSKISLAKSPEQNNPYGTFPIERFPSPPNDCSDADEPRRPPPKVHSYHRPERSRSSTGSRSSSPIGPFTYPPPEHAGSDWLDKMCSDLMRQRSRLLSDLDDVKAEAVDALAEVTIAEGELAKEMELTRQLVESVTKVCGSNIMKEIMQSVAADLDGRPTDEFGEGNNDSGGSSSSDNGGDSDDDSEGGDDSGGDYSDSDYSSGSSRTMERGHRDSSPRSPEQRRDLGRRTNRVNDSPRLFQVHSNLQENTPPRRLQVPRGPEDSRKNKAVDQGEHSGSKRRRLDSQGTSSRAAHSVDHRSQAPQAPSSSERRDPEHDPSNLAGPSRRTSVRRPAPSSQPAGPFVRPRLIRSEALLNATEFERAGPSSRPPDATLRRSTHRQDLFEPVHHLPSVHQPSPSPPLRRSQRLTGMAESQTTGVDHALGEENPPSNAPSGSRRPLPGRHAARPTRPPRRELERIRVGAHGQLELHRPDIPSRNGDDTDQEDSD